MWHTGEEREKIYHRTERLKRENKNCCSHKPHPHTENTTYPEWQNNNLNRWYLQNHDTKHSFEYVECDRREFFLFFFFFFAFISQLNAALFSGIWVCYSNNYTDCVVLHASELFLHVNSISFSYRWDDRKPVAQTRNLIVIGFLSFASLVWPIWISRLFKDKNKNMRSLIGIFFCYLSNYSDENQKKNELWEI